MQLTLTTMHVGAHDETEAGGGQNIDGYGITKRYAEKREFMPQMISKKPGLFYTESAVGKTDVVSVQYVDEHFLSLPDQDLVLTVAGWRLVEGTGVCIVANWVLKIIFFVRVCFPPGTQTCTRAPAPLIFDHHW